MTLIIDKNIDRLSQGKFVELTDIMVELPRRDSLVEALGLYEDVYLTQKRFEIQRTQYGSHLVKDKNWDEKADTLVSKPVRGFIQAKIPNFEVRDAIKPSDVDGIAKIDNIQEAAGLEQVMDVRMEKLAVINDAFDLTKEHAKMHMLMTGQVYAPTGTLATSYGDTIDVYQEFGVTRATYDLKVTGANDPRLSVSAMVRGMKEALRKTPAGGNYRELVVLCGSQFFDALYTNPFVTEAVKYFQQDLNKLLLKTPDAAPAFGINARFVQLWNVTFIDAGDGGYDAPDGTFVQWIAPTKAVAIPLGVRGMFKTYYAPANTFSAINKRSAGRYYFEKLNDEDDLIVMKVEHNFMCFMLYPQAVFDVTFS